MNVIPPEHVKRIVKKKCVERVITHLLAVARGLLECLDDQGGR